MNTSKSTWQEAEHHLALADKIMANLIDRYSHCRLSPQTEYFRQLCWSIIGQQLATKAADAIFNRFSAYYANDLSAYNVAATAPENLRAIGLSGQKVSYIHDLSKKVLNGEIYLSSFRELSDQEIITQLTSVKGIGVWTAQMFLIFALNRPDVLPADDLGVKKAVSTCYHLETLTTKKELEIIAQPWRPWRSVASWYLWRSLENS